MALGKSRGESSMVRHDVKWIRQCRVTSLRCSGGRRVLGCVNAWTRERVMIEIGMRVMYCREFLRNTGQFTGQPAPTSWGPFARGIVSDSIPLGSGNSVAQIDWDNGETTKALDANLHEEGKPELA